MYAAAHIATVNVTQPQTMMTTMRAAPPRPLTRSKCVPAHCSVIHCSRRADDAASPNLSRRVTLTALVAGLAIARGGPGLARAADVAPPPQPAPTSEQTGENNVPGGAKGSSDVPGNVKGGKDVPGGAKGGKDVPGGAKGSGSEEETVDSGMTAVPLSNEELQGEAARRLAEEEEKIKAARKKRRGRLRELEEIRAELAEKELELLQKGAELQEKEQSLSVLKEEIELEKRLRALLTKEKEKAEEQAALAMGLCTGGSMLP